MSPMTPLGALYHQADQHPAQVALIAGREVWSYRQLVIAVDNVAQALHTRGVHKGDRVVLHMGNVVELVIAYYACFRIGAIAAPLNLRLKAPELRSRLQQLRPSLYIGQAHLYTQIAAVESDILPADARYIVGDTGGLESARSWMELFAGSNTTVELQEGGPDDPAILLGTSGTTGLPKFVTHSANTLAAAAAGCRQLGLASPQIAIIACPMMHASGFFCALSCLSSEAVTILLERFDPDVVLDAVEHYRASWVVGLPFMAGELVRRQRAQPRKIESLEFCATAGDICPLKLQQEFTELFGVPLHSFWAATEIIGALIHGLQPGPVTRIAAGTQVRLVDDTGATVPRGECGEMLIRAAAVTTGYWQGPGQLHCATTGGWYHTGDLLRQGDQDDLWFVGRKKDLIIRGGSNIVPAEVERVLLEHPAVIDAAVVGVDDEDLGQRVAGFVRLAGCSGSYVVDDILNSVRARLADYKVPESLHVVDEIPRNALGKIDRHALMQILTDIARQAHASSPRIPTATQLETLS